MFSVLRTFSANYSSTFACLNSFASNLHLLYSVLVVQVPLLLNWVPLPTRIITATRTQCWENGRERVVWPCVDVAKGTLSSTLHCPTQYKSASSGPDWPTTTAHPPISYWNIKVRVEYARTTFLSCRSWQKVCLQCVLSYRKKTEVTATIDFAVVITSATWVF